MLLRERKRNKKWIWISVGVLILIALVVTGVVIAINNNGGKSDEGNNDGNNGTSADIGGQTSVNGTSNENNAGVNEEEKFAEEEVAKKKVVQYEGEDPNNSGVLTGTLTYSGVTNGMLVIRMSIDQYVGAGTCDLALMRSGETVYKSVANVRGDASTSTCEGFDVPVSELGPGSLEVVINITADGKTGVIRGEADI